MRGLTVVVVDDECAVARAISRLVASLGFAVVMVTNALEVERALEQCPAAVLSDYRMPHRNGAQVLALARQLAPTALRVLVTATPVDDAALTGLRPVHVLPKPFMRAELAALLGVLSPS